MKSTKFVVLAALTVGVASFAAFNGVPSSLRLGREMSQLEGNTTTQSLSFVALHAHVNFTYQALSQLEIAAPRSAPVNPLLLLDNASCGMDEAAEVATRQGTSPVQPLTLVNNETVVNSDYLFPSGQGPAKVCV
jgi:hypothetical protein